MSVTTNYTVANVSTYSSTMNGYTISMPGNWTTTNYTPLISTTAGQSNVKIDADDIVLNGLSLKDTIEKLLDRMAILVPDPAKLEKFAALKECYEQYKLLEKLCTETPSDDNKI